MLNWRNLAPHRPLEENDGLYVPRPGGDSRLAKLIAVTSVPIAITGPVGSGKSTELAQAAGHIRANPMFDAWLVRVDRQADMGKLTGTQLLSIIARTIKLKDPSSSFSQEAWSYKIDEEFSQARDYFLWEIRARQRSLGKTLVILVDGLEKCVEDQAISLVRTLFELRDELRIVAVIPYWLVVGPVASSIIQVHEAKVYSVRAIALRGPVTSHRWKELLTEPGHRFFYNLAEQRLGNLEETPSEFRYQLLRMASLSGGVPRVFLQLLLGAANNAQIADREWPNAEDWEDAIRGQIDSLRLLLRDGDLIHLRMLINGSADVSELAALEIPLERRLRFLAQGLILEYEQDKKRIVYPAPLLFELLGHLLPS